MFTMIPMKDLGEALYHRRIQHGLTQRQLGDRIGKDPAYISRLEQGRAKETPPPEVLQLIADTLDFSQAELLAMIGYPVGEPATTETITVRADDPRAAVLRVLEGATDADVLKALTILEVVIDYATPNAAQSPHHARSQAT